MAQTQSDELSLSSLTRRQKKYSIIAAAIVIVLVGSLLWWTKVYKSPQNVFWGMLSSNLSTVGVTRHVTESVSGQALDEYIQIRLGSVNIVRSVSTVTQNGNSVTTETIGTPTTDYTRYTNVNTASKGKNGKTLDFSSVLGVWGKSSGPAQGQVDDALNHLFGQTLLGVVPIANLPNAEQESLLSYMKSANVFVPNLSSVQHKVVNGKNVYVYNVTINAQSYAALMQQFAEDLGLGKPSEFNPNNYQGSEQLKLDFAVDPISRQLVSISYPGQTHTEGYSGYGISPVINEPTNTITTTALQAKLAAIQ